MRNVSLPSGASVYVEPRHESGGEKDRRGSYGIDVVTLMSSGVRWGVAAHVTDII